MHLISDILRAVSTIDLGNVKIQEMLYQEEVPCRALCNQVLTKTYKFPLIMPLCGSSSKTTFGRRPVRPTIADAL